MDTYPLRACAHICIVCVELCHGNKLGERRWGLCLMWSNSWNISMPAASVSHICFPCVRACWERNPNYRPLLADKGQRCLMCTVRHRKWKMKPHGPAFHPSHTGRQADCTRPQRWSRRSARRSWQRRDAAGSSKQGPPHCSLKIYLYVGDKEQSLPEGYY